MDYSKLIKRIRSDLLVTQEELAKMLNVTFATVNRWENGLHEPTMTQRRKIRDLCRKHKINMEE